MRPTSPRHHFNFDATQYYYYKGALEHIGNSESLCRVSIDSLTRDKRGDSSLQKDANEEPLGCKGIQVTFMVGLCGAGKFFPIVAIIKRLSKIELPNDDCIAITIPGLCHNGDLDARGERPVYLVLVREGTSMDDILRWYIQKVIWPTIQSIRNLYNRSDNSQEVVQKDHNVVQFDSDMSILKFLTQIEIMEEYIEKKNVMFSKIGAKITKGLQILDRGSFF